VLTCRSIFFFQIGLLAIHLFQHNIQIVATIQLPDPAVYRIVKG
jgi:hypothetical protein